MPQVFPNSVTSAQKSMWERLWLLLSTANPISVQEQACLPSRNDAAHEEGEIKKALEGGEPSLGISKLLKSVFLRVPREAA